MASVVLEISIAYLLIIACAHAAPLNDGTQETKPHTSRVLTDDLFEGDLKLSKEKIRKNYNLSSIPGGGLMFDEDLGNGSDLIQEADGIRSERAA